MDFTLGKKIGYLLVGTTLLLSACSNGGWIIQAEMADDEANRAPASSEPVYASVAPSVGNPCSSIRYIQEETAKTSKPELYRCNVVLSDKLHPESKFSTEDADFCVGLSEHMDDRKTVHPYFQVNGLLLSLKNKENNRRIKNVLVRSSRMAGEAYEKSNQLNFKKSGGVTQVSDLIPLSGGKQLMQFDHEKKILSYEVYENKSLLFTPIEDADYSVSVRLQCTKDVIYSSVSKNFVKIRRR